MMKSIIKLKKQVKLRRGKTIPKLAHINPTFMEHWELERRHNYISLDRD